MKANSIIAVVAVLFAIPCVSAAGATSGESDALPFVRVNHDPVSAAMGGAGVVNASAYSSFRNTAALTYWDKTFDVAAGYQSWSSGETQNITVGAGWKLAKGKVAVSLGGNYGMLDEYNVYDENGGAKGTYRPSEMQINVGAAWKFLPFLSVGADVKYLSNKLANNESASYAIGIDAFLMTKLADFRIAAGVSSIGTSVKSASGQKYSLPTSITVGGGYDHEFGKHGLNVALDLDYYYSSSEFIGALGAQYSYNKLVFVRAGYHYAADSAVIPSYASVGVGVQFIGIRLDVAYMLATSSASALKNTLTVGLGYSF